MKLIDLFSGIGGFSLASNWAGIETILFVEKNKFCQKILMKNFPNIPIIDDIKLVNGKYYKPDIITGGFPCQPFSIAGKKKGFLDDRYLWPEMFKVIKQSKPRYIIAENVPGIISHVDTILEDLENENYTCETYLIPASLIGAPHKRERLWIIAYRNSKRCNIWINHRKEGYFQNNIKRYMETIQSEWKQFEPFTWKNYTINEWLQANARFMRINDGLPNRMDRIKAIGNSIIPQIAYVFLKSIILLENNN